MTPSASSWCWVKLFEYYTVINTDWSNSTLLHCQHCLMMSKDIEVKLASLTLVSHVCMCVSEIFILHPDLSKFYFLILGTDCMNANQEQIRWFPMRICFDYHLIAVCTIHSSVASVHMKHHMGTSSKKCQFQSKFNNLKKLIVCWIFIF